MIVTRRRNQLFPCNKCRFKDNIKHPLTQVHSVQQRTKTYLTNLKSGKEQDQGYQEILGECLDYQPIT